VTSLRYFTVAQANALLPEIANYMGDMMVVREIIIQKRPDMWPVLQKAAGNGGSRHAGEMVEHFRQFESYLKEIQNLGVVVRDVNIGLVDFPSLRKGQEIFLCWRYGEEKIAFWHDRNSGYRGRRPLWK